MAALLLAPWSVLFVVVFLVSGTNARALVQDPSPPFSLNAQVSRNSEQWPLPANQFVAQTFRDLRRALDVMQDDYFELWQGTWPTGIDWTRAVLGTHVSATLSALTASADDSLLSSLLEDAVEGGQGQWGITQNSMALENLVNHYFAHVMAFYFGEDAFALRTQAYDDMMWVVLGWLENIKFQVLHSDLHYENPGRPWHGTQFRSPAAHRVRVFYDLASQGWDTALCTGGMIWSPYLTPYKNAITNELFREGEQSADDLPHSADYLHTAIEAYRWLKDSNMTGLFGMYADGFHVRGWKSDKQPGTRKCDILNTMVYTYNQGVILSGLRGLWLATGTEQYLDDGHELVRNVMRATGWPNVYDQRWMGLGRAGILEDSCDSKGDCSQDGQTFKGIFFHHFAEFCRPIHPHEERFLRTQAWAQNGWKRSFGWHQTRCSHYYQWIEHNANAALATRNDDGKFGMWWGRKYRVFDRSLSHESPLPHGATDYRNYPDSTGPAWWWKKASELASTMPDADIEHGQPEYNDRGRGRTVETQSGGVAVLRALYQWKATISLSAGRRSLR
ncbi:hypothetical protein ARAM_006974 [Aspergillus rambellii]|uniref:Glycosyl hydrolase n=1 Tax=Aspergillus rambellii TaxID=308745 RepID=A0A0F8U081_9EURO|nr:hypothetical protein ARAM_006974 [Aspergillus rambellii]